ncbi:MAG: YlxR family protein [Clostridiales bacterium]|nr:YlxR family protein [Clostridiales bacterium]
MQQRKIPLRKCVGCNESKPKRELVRIVKSPEGDISLDETGKKSGRGAYICPDAECLKRARKARRLEKIFEAPVPDTVYDELERKLAEHDG